MNYHPRFTSARNLTNDMPPCPECGNNRDVTKRLSKSNNLYHLCLNISHGPKGLYIPGKQTGRPEQDPYPKVQARNEDPLCQILIKLQKIEDNQNLIMSMLDKSNVNSSPQIN